MRPPRNPFRLRTSEQIDDDWRFANLYEPGLIDLLPEEGLWDRRVIVRSSAGGGKTTLLRAFTPGPLRVIHRNGARNDQTGDLYRRLERRQALDRNGPTIAAARVSLAGKYTSLNQLQSIDEGARLRAFISLLDVRIVIAGLRAHLQLAGLRFPEDLTEISVTGEFAENPHGSMNGMEILDATRGLERRVARILSSLRPPSDETLPGDDELRSLTTLGEGGVHIKGKGVSARAVVLLDDVHRLAAAQRNHLLDSVLAERTATPVWIAERREALAPEELLSEGAKDDRDRIVIDIERFWRSSRRKSFKRLLAGVANRRMALSVDTPGSSFAAMLAGSNEELWEKVMPAVEDRLKLATQDRQEFRSWVESRLHREATNRERAIGMRSLEIRIERELAAKQLSMDLLVRDESALTELEERQEASDLREAAELFLHREFDLPFYFGEDRLAQLASANVDQFLAFAGDLFEELAGISGTNVIRANATLSSERQEHLLRRAVRRMWDELGSGVEEAARVRSLLDGIGSYCSEKTYLPNAPYAPGVTGVALRTSEASQLQDACQTAPDSPLGVLGRVLSVLIAHNLITVQASEAKEQRWAVYYLNRAWCVRYRLPLQFGGWQPVDIERMWQWTEGRTTPQQQLSET